MKKQQQLVAFSLDDSKFALHLLAVQRIVRVVEVTILPKAPDIVVGIINLQGQLIPVFDLRMRFGLPTRETRLNDQMIIATTVKRTVALIVDSVDDVIETPAEHIFAAEKILPDLEYVEGVLKMEDGMVFIHDLERFLSPWEEKALCQALEEVPRDER